MVFKQLPPPPTPPPNPNFDPIKIIRWVFEKYDGVRGFWNPEKKAFYSRNGNIFSFPQEVIDSMPTDLFLDGEIWLVYLYHTKERDINLHSPIRFGKENFQEAMKIASRSVAAQIDWKAFKYMVFDIPNHSGTYSERYDHLGN